MPTSQRRGFPLAVFLAVALTACGGSLTGAGESGGGGRPADFSLPDITGRRIHLSDYLGDKVVLINFWATWCGPCAGEMPHLQRLYETYGDDGFVVLGVSMDGPESIAEVAPFAHRHGLTYPILLDEETRVVEQLNPAQAAPFNILIGRDGTIVSTSEGFSTGDERTLEQAVRTLLAAPRAGDN